MNMINNDVTSGSFEVSSSIGIGPNQFKLAVPSTSHHPYADYLRTTISVPLSYALTFVLTHRPSDPIEFISQFLVDWSNKTIIDLQSDDKNQSLTQVSQIFDVKQQLNEIRSDSHRSNVHSHQDTEEESCRLVIENLDYTYETACESEDSIIDSIPIHSCPSGHKPMINYVSHRRDQ